MPDAGVVDPPTQPVLIGRDIDAFATDWSKVAVFDFVVTVVQQQCAAAPRINEPHPERSALTVQDA